MTPLLLSDDQLSARTAVAAGPLAPLAAGLCAELDQVIARDVRVRVPTGKARLTRIGGRCAIDGAQLDFDPFVARHRCPQCDCEEVGREHDDFRLYWQHLWFAERAVHAAVLARLTGRPQYGRFAERMLADYLHAYPGYPLADNVLGPSRPFFSTYLESIWLLQLLIADDMLGNRPGRDDFRRGLVEPSVELIATYDEGMSNRQVWNNVAMLAGGVALGNHSLVERAIHGDSGLLSHMQRALLDDGTWYEGENYHFFAHRGLWYGVQLAAQSGLELPAPALTRYRMGFAAPFASLQPDLTFPSRRDSPYAVSARQPRFAESCELGVADHGGLELVSLLGVLYDGEGSDGETRRFASSADVERNGPAQRLSRADLSWRALLFASPELPHAPPWRPASVLLGGQGLAVLRADTGDAYASLDYGHGGGGHGHSDRLNVTLIHGSSRYLVDPGTGSYVDPSLHWYRSTLAHNAPLVNGRSQPPVAGSLVAFDARDDVAWVESELWIQDTALRRTLVLSGGHCLDLLRWHSLTPAVVSLPMHGAFAPGARTTPVDDVKMQAAEWLSDVAACDRAADVTLRIDSPSGPPLFGVSLGGPADTMLTAMAPAPPGTVERRPLVVRSMSGVSGECLVVWSWTGEPAVWVEGDAVCVTIGDLRSTHRRTAFGWDVTCGDERRELHGIVDRDDESITFDEDDEETPDAAHELALPVTVHLGREHYRRSELTWDHAGSPVADVALCHERGSLHIDVTVPHSARRFVSLDAQNPLDNEPAAINGDGLQLYLRILDQASGLLIVPVPGSETLAMQPAGGWPHDLRIEGEWQPMGHDGWRASLRCDVPSEADVLELDVIVNEIGPSRERRRGQLVLSGAAGEFVYLRGDRHDPLHLIAIPLHDG